MNILSIVWYLPDKQKIQLDYMQLRALLKVAGYLNARFKMQWVKTIKVSVHRAHKIYWLNNLGFNFGTISVWVEEV